MNVPVRAAIGGRTVISAGACGVVVGQSHRDRGLSGLRTAVGLARRRVQQGAGRVEVPLAEARQVLAALPERKRPFERGTAGFELGDDLDQLVARLLVSRFCGIRDRGVVGCGGYGVSVVADVVPQRDTYGGAACAAPRSPIGHDTYRG
jgi:hypothetical protein